MSTAILGATVSAASGDRYTADWESLAAHHESPKWFKDAKFGIYFHWGPYSVPAFGNEHYPRTMYGHPSGKKPVQTKKSKFKPAIGFQTFREHEFHKETYGDPAEFEYHDLVPLFTAEHFSAEAWADLFYLSGAKFAGPVAEHHDGYAMWDSDLTPWNSADTGPERDITGELEKAIRKRGMKFITTFHHAKCGRPDSEDPKVLRQWHYYGREMHLSRTDPDRTDSPDLRKMYGNMDRQEWLGMWNGKLEEVIDKYQPDLIWFDSWLDRIPEKNRQEFAAYYLNAAEKWDREVVITYKQEDMPRTVGVEDFEKGRMDEITDFTWLTDDTISAGSWTTTGSWSYSEELDIKSGKTLVHTLVDIVSKNGNLLLNISPKADGTIPEEQVQSLMEVGTWLRANGEAIYGTRPYTVYGEGPKRMTGGGHFIEMKAEYNHENIRFTTKGSTIYAVQLGWPGSGVEVRMKALSKAALGDIKIESVSVVDSSDTLQWEQTDDALVITSPESPSNEIAICYKIETNGLASYGPYPSVISEEKPDRPMSAAMQRMYDQWNPHEDFGNELYSNFKYTKIEGFEGSQRDSRRDPTKVIKVGDTYHVWYTSRRTEHDPVGFAKQTDTKPANDWDLCDIWHATSQDGWKWEEQGKAVSRLPKGEIGGRSICTPDILVWEGKYYLYFQAYESKAGGDGACYVRVAVADSPYGPWEHHAEPVIGPGEPDAWNSAKINDPYLIVHDGKIKMFFKGAPIEKGPEYILRMQGVAYADNPLGPFVESPLNPVINSGHETCAWPWKEGIAVLIALDGPEKNTIQYAADGENFEIQSLIQIPPIAPGPYIPDAFDDTDDGRGITWGLCHVNPKGGGSAQYSSLVRFDCDLSQDVDRPILKRNNLRFNIDTYQQRNVKLAPAYKQQIQQAEKRNNSKN